jgi:hypothetical protein
VGVSPSVGQNAVQKGNTHASHEDRNPTLKSVAIYKLSQFMLKILVNQNDLAFFGTHCGIFRFTLKRIELNSVKMTCVSETPRL